MPGRNPWPSFFVHKKLHRKEIWRSALYSSHFRCSLTWVNSFRVSAAIFCTAVSVHPLFSLLQKFFDILLWGCDRSNLIILHQEVQNIRRYKSWQRRAKADIFNSQMRSVSRMHTAFCSYQDRTKERGSSLTEQPKASAKAAATCIAP